MPKTTDEKIDERDGGMYLWEKNTLRHVDESGRDIIKTDTEKKPPIPESNEARKGVVKKFKDKMADQSLYEWGRHTLRKIDELGRDVLKLDTAKYPDIPERSSRASRLKAAIDKQGERARRIYDKFKKRIKG